MNCLACCCPFSRLRLVPHLEGSQLATIEQPSCKLGRGKGGAGGVLKRVLGTNTSASELGSSCLYAKHLGTPQHSDSLLTLVSCATTNQPHCFRHSSWPEGSRMGPEQDSRLGERRIQLSVCATKKQLHCAPLASQNTHTHML